MLGVFQLFANDIRQDRMLMVTANLRKRLDKFKRIDDLVDAFKEEIANLDRENMLKRVHQSLLENTNVCEDLIKHIILKYI
jgi:hypothetical protein